MFERKKVLTGATRKIVVEIDDKKHNVYITVNQQDGKPFEIFVRCDHPQFHEWIMAITVLVTMLLRSGVPLADIAGELQCIHSGATSSHFLPGGDRCISLVARIGKVLEDF